MSILIDCVVFYAVSAVYQPDFRASWVIEIWKNQACSSNYKNLEFLNKFLIIWLISQNLLHWPFFKKFNISRHVWKAARMHFFYQKIDIWKYSNASIDILNVQIKAFHLCKQVVWQSKDMTGRHFKFYFHYLTLIKQHSLSTQYNVKYE